MRVPRRRRLLLLLTILATMFASLFAAIATAPSASASHYRANQMSWHKGAGTNEAEFHIGGSWRCTFFFTPCNPTVGQTFSAGQLEFGDGTSAGITFEVVSFDAVNDVVTGEAHVSHTYASAGPFTAAATDCCRLSASGGHMNNPDGSTRFETVVDFARTSASPVALVAPIVDCPVNAVCRFTVPAADPDNQALAWRLSTSAEAGPGFIQPSGATVNASTGLYTWDTSGAALASSGPTFYSTQVMVENVVGGTVISRTAVDFFIRLGSNSTNQQPVFDSPTPADGATIPATVGTALMVNVAASDPDTADTVQTQVLGLPAGATYTPTNGNPASGVLAWTPTAAGDYPITFTAQDQLGLGAIPRGAIIRVSAPVNQAPVVDAGSNVTGSVGAPISLNGTITDTDPVTSTWSATPGADVAPGATCSFADPTQVDTTVSCTGPGTWTLKLTASDGTNPAVSDTVTLTVTKPKLPAEITCETAKAQGPGAIIDGRKVVVGTAGSGHQIVLGKDGGNITLSGGSGNDLLCAWGGKNVLDGGSGDDTLVVMDGANNRLIGGSGNDTMIGFAADTFDGGTGNNTTIKK